MSRCSRLVVMLSVVLAPCVAPARGEAEPIPVQILHGSLDAVHIVGQLSLTGNHGFTFNGGVGTSIGGVFGLSMTCDPCLPGAPIDLTAHWGGNDLGGTATFQGVTYSQVGSVSGDRAVGTVRFSGSAVAPPLTGLTETIVAPFVFDGMFIFPPAGTSRGTSASLNGLGNVTVVLRRRPDLAFWTWESAVYEFEPIPEPGTLMLVGTALAGLALRRRRNG
jgi:hypothetical protein